jgi:hypothetical protein
VFGNEPYVTRAHVGRSICGLAVNKSEGEQHP